MFYLYWMLKPFYLFESGGLQIADIFLAAAFAGMLCSDVFYIKTIDKEVLLFTVCVFIVNGFYSCMGDTGFLKSSLYYLYNAGVILLVLNLGENLKFAHNLKNITFFNLLVQCAIYITGSGKMYGESRYEGTFNDPNQFGFSVLTMFLVIFIIDEWEGRTCKKKKRLSVIAYILALFLILKSLSTGMLMGIAIFTGLFFLRPRGAKAHAGNGGRKMLVRIVLCVFAGMLVMLAGLQTCIHFLETSDNGTLLRIAGKLETYLNGDGLLKGAVNERGIDKLYVYPQYLLLGSGEGSWNRFIQATQYEVHSTFPAILFYYGIVPTIILLIWIGSKCRKCNYLQWTALMALIAESFILANQRQPAFWVLLVLPSALNKCGCYCLVKKSALAEKQCQ